MASQLLNEHSNANSYKRQRFPPPSAGSAQRWRSESTFVPSHTGLLLTGIVSLAFALTIRWLVDKAAKCLNRSFFLLLSLAATIILVVSYYYLRHQWLHYLRTQAIENASSLTSNAQEFDAATSAGITMIQEVELVSRGYNMYYHTALLAR